MPNTPNWLAAASGSQGQAGQINQFLGTHGVTFIYFGTLQSSQTTVGTGSTSSNGTYIAQSFSTAVGQTTIGRIGISLGITGTPTTTWAISIQANSAGAPSGTPLVTVQLPQEFFIGGPGFIGLPVPVTVTASSQYWIVANANGTVSNSFFWSKSNQVSGASTSPTGVTWTAQAYGLLYNVYDNTLTGNLNGPLHTWEDSGSKWSLLGYSNDVLSQIFDYTVGQTATSYLTSARNLTYGSGTYLTTVA